jgi:hypothetical protein
MDHKFLSILFPLQTRDTHRFTEEELLIMEKSAILHQVWQLMFTALQNRSRLDPSQKEVEDFLKKRKTIFLKHAATSIKQQVYQEKLINQLKKYDIPAIVLKGSSIAQSIYQTPNARSSCDIDLLIRESDIEKTDALLCQEDYRHADTVSLLFLQLRLHHTTYYSSNPSWNIPLEVHWNFTIPGFFKLSSQQIWEKTQCDKDGYHTLSAEMTFILLLMHHHRHAFKELRNLVDLTWAFYRFEEIIDWRALVKQIIRIGLVKTSYLTLSQIETLWPEQSRNLAGLQTFKAGINTTTNSQKVLNRLAANISSFEDQSFTTKDKIIYRLALDHWGNVISSFLKTILPPPRVIQRLYSDNSNWRLPFNYLRFLRWRFLGSSLP